MTTDEFRIEPATEADIARLSEILEANFRSRLRGVVSDEQAEYMRTKFCTPDALRLEAARGDVYLKLHHRGDIRAFASHCPTPVPDEWKLHKLFVDPQWHRKGFGDALIAYVQQQARSAGCKTLMLTVNKHNAGAIALYQKNGFEIREPIEIDIGNGFYLDDYVMVHTLPPD